MIPPSGLAVIIGAIGNISIGQILIAIIMPGILMAVIIAAYVIIRCKLQPELAPASEVKSFPLSEKLRDTVFYIFPIAIVIFLVIGVMMLGIATPTEAAVTGTLGTLILAAIYRKLNFKLFRESVRDSLKVTVMCFMMIVTASSFSQVLAFSGATTGLTQIAAGLNVAPILIIIAMQLVVLIMGCFMDTIGIIMITLPIFMPIVDVLHINPVWFAVMLLINCAIAAISPPFGLSLFVMKGVGGKTTTMGDVYKAGAVASGISLVSMAIVMAFPIIAMWLPGFMKTG